MTNSCQYGNAVRPQTTIHPRDLMQRNQTTPNKQPQQKITQNCIIFAIYYYLCSQTFKTTR